MHLHVAASVRASHANEIKMVGVYNICACRTHILTIRKVNVFQPSCTACGFNSAMPLP